MPAVSNTSPISNLASIGRLELLKSQFSSVFIPEGVAAELAAHPDPLARDRIELAVQEQWIQVCTAPASSLLRLLLLQLHRGEAEAITLATDIKADRLLMDEQEGRTACRSDRPSQLPAFWACCCARSARARSLR